jgi:hypothetical protein
VSERLLNPTFARHTHLHVLVHINTFAGGQDYEGQLASLENELERCAADMDRLQQLVARSVQHHMRASLVQSVDMLKCFLLHVDLKSIFASPCA